MYEWTAGICSGLCGCSRSYPGRDATMHVLAARDNGIPLLIQQTAFGYRFAGANISIAASKLITETSYYLVSCHGFLCCEDLKEFWALDASTTWFKSHPILGETWLQKSLFLCVCLCLGYHASVSLYMFLSLYVSLIKDQNANLSRIIPLRLYGDGCEATRALTGCVACREVLRIDFSVVNYASVVWNWKSLFFVLPKLTGTKKFEMTSLLWPASDSSSTMDMRVLLLGCKELACGITIRPRDYLANLCLLWLLWPVQADCFQCDICAKWWSSGFNSGIFAMELRSFEFL